MLRVLDRLPDGEASLPRHSRPFLITSRAFPNGKDCCRLIRAYKQQCPMSSEGGCISCGPAGSTADLSGKGVTQLISTQRPGPSTPLINFRL